jgi:hypothetical protein
MTVFFWRKRPSKILSATLLFFIVLATVFFYRRPIAINSIEHFTKPYDLTIACLDFSFDWRLNLRVKQACITSPIGEMVVSEAIWQPWSNLLNIEHIKIEHFEHFEYNGADNKVDKAPSLKHQKEQNKDKLTLPDSLPLSVKLNISSLEINSFELLQPLHLSVNSISRNKLSISGDINASVTMNQNTLIGNLSWSLSDLTKWMPQAQQLSQDNPELLKQLAIDDSKINTNLTFDGKVLNANSSLDIDSRIDVSECPIDVLIKGDLLLNVDTSSLNISLDLSQLSSGVSAINCPLLHDYFAEDDLPQLAFVFAQKITLDETQIKLPKFQIVDKQNTHRSIMFSALKYKTTGELEVNYNISLKQPIKTKQLAASMLDFQAKGSVFTDLSTLNTQSAERPIIFKINDDNNQLVVNDLKMDSLFIGKLTSEFSFQHTSLEQFKIKGAVDNTDVQIDVINIAKTSSDFSISGANFNNLQLILDNHFFQLSHPDVSLQKISNHIELNIKEFETLSFYGDSTITNVSTQNIKFMPIDVTHIGEASLPNMTVSSVHEIKLEHGFLLALEQQQTQAKVRINQQDIISLQSVISQLENTAVVKEGKLSASIELTLPQEGEQFIAKGNADFRGLSVKYQDYVFNNMTYQTPLTFDSAGLQLTESTLHLDLIDVGVTIEEFEAKVIAQNSVLRLKQAQGKLLNGEFSFANLWLDGREQQFNINFKNIDLAQIVALQQQPGIQITGNIDGDMPLIIDKHGIRIDDGWMSSLTGGKLTIVDNPSFDSIKAQQPQLALLENLDFTQLESNVKFTPDGWVFFDFAIQGNNPDKKQSVNFNYSHQENIFSLLEAIRLVKSIESKVEQKITQGDKK